MDKSYCIITTTVDSQDVADKIVLSLLEQKLAACIQTHDIKSHYRWQGKLESSDEIILKIKTKSSLFEQVKQEITLLHTYDIPQIVSVKIDKANKDYFDWLENETL